MNEELRSTQFFGGVKGDAAHSGQGGVAATGPGSEDMELMSLNLKLQREGQQQEDQS